MKTEIRFDEGYSPLWIDKILEIHNKTEMKRSVDCKQIVSDAFNSSFAVVTAWSDSRLIGFGRMISDCKMYSSIFDVVIDPDFQKRGIGQEIMKKLIDKTPPVSFIILTATTGKEPFYAKLGFRKHKTAMALYRGSKKPSPYLELWPPKHSDVFYGMIVEESLTDPTVINNVSVSKVKITNPDRWHIYTVTTSELQVEKYQAWLKDDPWYMHFWRGDEIVVVFKDKSFSFSKNNKSMWGPAINYGKSLGIPEEQLDFLTEI